MSAHDTRCVLLVSVCASRIQVYENLKESGALEEEDDRVNDLGHRLLREVDGEVGLARDLVRVIYRTLGQYRLTKHPRGDETNRFR